MSNPFGLDLEVLAEAFKMKTEGANNTQLRAYLEEHGITGIVFDNEDLGAAGIPPEMNDEAKQFLNVLTTMFNTPSFPFDLPLIRQRDMQLLGPDRSKAEMFDFTRPLRHQAIINSLSGGKEKHYGVLSTEEQKQQGYKNMPDKSIGESEYIRPEDRDALLSGYSPEEQMGMKLPDDLAAKLSKPLPEGKIPFDEEVLPTGFNQINKMIEGGVRPGDMIAFGAKTSASPRSVFAPIFDQARAQRHLYKSLIVRMNEELSQGPLAGLLFITGARRNNTPGVLVDMTFEFTVKMRKTKSGEKLPSYRAMNRYRAYAAYFESLRKKYIRAVHEADKQVMERE